MVNRRRKTNNILEDYGDWLLVDISTSKHPDATMAVDSDVWERHEGGRVGASKPGKSKYIYATFLNEKKLDFHHSVLPTEVGMEIDHKKHGTMSYIDNRRSNLRYATRSQNNQNKSVQLNSPSGVSGVTWNKSKKQWMSQIMVDGEVNILGFFDEIELAKLVRKDAEREFFGEFAFRPTGEKTDLEKLKEIEPILHHTIAVERLKLLVQSSLYSKSELQNTATAKLVSKSGVRMARKRKREACALYFWRMRIKNGSAYMPLINDALENAPGIVEKARILICDELADYKETYPERFEPVTK